MNILYNAYLLILLASFFAGMTRFKKLDRAARVYAILLGVTLVDETAAHWAAILFKNNLAVYAVFNVVQLIFYGIYFSRAIPAFGRRRLWLIVGVAAVVAGIINMAFLQPPTRILNSYYLIFEAIVVIPLAMLALPRLPARAPRVGYQNPHFWIILLTALLWAENFIGWGMYPYFRAHLEDQLPAIHLALLLTNMAIYLLFGVIFLYCYSPKQTLGWTNT